MTTSRWSRFLMIALTVVATRAAIGIIAFAFQKEAVAEPSPQMQECPGTFPSTCQLVQQRQWVDGRLRVTWECKPRCGESGGGNEGCSGHIYVSGGVAFLYCTCHSIGEVTPWQKCVLSAEYSGEAGTWVPSCSRNFGTASCSGDKPQCNERRCTKLGVTYTFCECDSE